MIKRQFQKDDAASEALYSGCETYRYALTRVWDDTAARVVFVMLNPSKATERQNDPTIERCERRARALGFGGFRAVNIFALRETDPHLMRKHKNPTGPENDQALDDACQWGDQVICGWGTHGAHHDRGPDVARILHGQGRVLHHLGLTKAGHPKHPLYIAYQTQPQLWDASDIQVYTSSDTST